MVTSRYKPEPTPLEKSPVALGYPRSAKGEFGKWQNGSYFSTSQQEWHKSHDWFVGMDAQFGIIEIETGEWLAGGCVRGERHPDRETALTAAAAECIRQVTCRATPYTNGRTFSPDITVRFANAVIQWAARVANIPAPLMAEPLPRQAMPSPVKPCQLDLFGKRKP